LRVLGPEEPIFAVEDRQVPSPAAELSVRVYRPREGVLPALMFFHGGGWVLGDLAMSDTICRRLANAADCLVFSVDYRLAPEHRFPAAVDDCYAATAWVAAYAEEIGADAERIAVSGVSAGGNLAAAVCLMARDRGGPAIVHQLLVCAVLDTDFTRISYIDNAKGYQLERGDMIWFWGQYLGDLALPIDQYAAPLQAQSLSGLPTAHVITAEYDPLRDEGAAYFQRLVDAGVGATYLNCEGMIHGVLGSPIPAGRIAFDEACRLLQASFSRTASVPGS
jgi:acetyl esterase